MKSFYLSLRIITPPKLCYILGHFFWSTILSNNSARVCGVCGFLRLSVLSFCIHILFVFSSNSL